MSVDRQAFLDAIELEPQDYTHRYVYADWLDERGEHEEADRQRKYEAAENWLRAFAMKHCESYGFGHLATEEEVTQYPEEYEGYTRQGDVYVPPEDETWSLEVSPYLQLMYFLNRHVDGHHYLPFDTPYGFDDYSDELWSHFEIVAGLPAPQNEHRTEMPPFAAAAETSRSYADWHARTMDRIKRNLVVKSSYRHEYHTAHESGLSTLLAITIRTEVLPLW